jgi:phospholipase/lecithinase/hemolysin
MQLDDQENNLNSRSNYELFVFGDSLSDTGNVYNATLRFFPPSPPYFNGRFSNGVIAAEILAEQLGLTLSQTTNFAVGGARTGRTNIFENGLLQLGGLSDQIDRFKAQGSNIGAGAEDLYFIWAGGNDLLNLSSDPVSAVNTAVTNIATAVTQLAESGARNIIVAQMPNLGRVPQAIESGQSQAVTELSLAFNNALASTLNALEASTRGINIILTDLFPISESVAQTPSTFGFTNVTSPFLVDLAPADPNANPDQFFFWDQVHPTTRGHALFANVFRQTALSDITEDVSRIGTQRQDKLVGFNGNDRLTGLAGADNLEGNGGNDTLIGGTQADRLVGGGSNDALIGNEGADLLRGGLGQDRFIYQTPDDGRDIIADFQLGRDAIDLKRLFNGAEYGQSNRFQAYVRVTSGNIGTENGTVVRVDTNGDRTGGFKAIAFLTNIATSDLTAANFLV